MDSVEIYRAPVVQEIVQHYGKTLFPTAETSIKNHLELLAVQMLSGLRQGKVCIFNEINNYHSNFLGTPVELLKNLDWRLSDSKHAIANEYGFNSWEDVLKLENEKYNMRFENCVNAILQGKIADVVHLLDEFPQLVYSYSPYGHNASLLHYCASNGFELWRQQVPLNLVEIINILRQKGASTIATMDVYRGKFTPLELASTSAHPIQAGIKKQLIQALKG